MAHIYVNSALAQSNRPSCKQCAESKRVTSKDLGQDQPPGPCWSASYLKTCHFLWGLAMGRPRFWAHFKPHILGSRCITFLQATSTASKKTPKALSGTAQCGHPPGRTPRVVRDHFLLRCHGQVWALRSFGAIAIDHLSPILMLIHLIHSGKSW